MKKKLKSGFLSQGYEAPHAESVEVAQESILCASQVNGGLESFGSENGAWDWEGPGGGPEGMTTKNGLW